MNVQHTKYTDKYKQYLVPFRLDIPEYDQSTYLGRFMSLVKIQNPLNTFVNNVKIQKCRNLVVEQRDLEKLAAKVGAQVFLDSKKVAEIRKAQYIIGSSVHPDTDEIIKPYQRFCSYSIINIPLLFGMIICKQTTTNIIFLQWMNQTYNAVLNYSNRNATSSLDSKGLVISYAAAVTASITIGLGMRRLLTPYSKIFKGPARLFFNFLINVTAIGCAGVLNVLIMRSKEMKEGITLTDVNGYEIGKSPKIGKEAVIKTALSRIILPFPPLLLPTIAFYLMEKRQILPKNRMAKILVETFVFF
jgi:hypothetical protein